MEAHERGDFMKFLEYMYYESLPYTYGTVGLYGMSQHELSKIAAMAGFVLAACSYQVFYKRYFHRTYKVRNQVSI